MIQTLRRIWDQVSIYLPVIVMALAALGTWRLVRSIPASQMPQPDRAALHEPDYFMRDFSVRTFDANGKLQSEIFGEEARHYPDTDTLEIDSPKMRSFDRDGRLMRSTARRALSNADASEVQLFGDAVVIREGGITSDEQAEPHMEFRGEFLHAFTRTERLKSHLPVVLIRGKDRFTADAMEYDHLDRVLNLTGSVRGTLAPADPVRAPSAQN